jgi:hypothetical protein
MNPLAQPEILFELNRSIQIYGRFFSVGRSTCPIFLVLGHDLSVGFHGEDEVGLVFGQHMADSGVLIDYFFDDGVVLKFQTRVSAFFSVRCN